MFTYLYVPLFGHQITALSLSCLYKFSPARPARRRSYFRCWRVRGFQPLSRHLSRTACVMTSNQENNRQRVKRLLEKPGNGNCADCGAAGRLEGSPPDAGPILQTCSYFSMLVFTVCHRTSYLFIWVIIN